jgi:DNA repair exonuclease SbcCD nuclease subunit
MVVGIPMSDLNRIAQELYGEDYSKLSPFGQYSVRLSLPRDGSIADYEKDQIIAQQAAKISRLEKENRELWEENEDLQVELLNKEEDDELRTTRSAGTREEAVSGDDPRSTAPLEDIRRRDPSSLSG